jgi:F-type H+-transporting ATPase subunit a
MFSPLEQFDVIGYSFTNTIFILPFLSVLLPLIILFILVYVVFVVLLSQELKLIPGTFQRLFELVVEFIFNLIKQQIGKEGYMFFPFIFVLFNFILFTIY